MKQCPQCGSPCNDTETTCRVCGYLLSGSSQTSTGAAQTGSPEEKARPYTEDYEQQATGQANKNNYNPNGNGYPYGGPPPYYPYYPTPRANPMAIASMVLGIVSFPLLCCRLLGLLPAILGLIFGFVSQHQIKRSQGSETGSGFATAGIVLGIISIAIVLFLAILFIIFVVAGISTSLPNDFKNFYNGTSHFNT